MSKTGVKIWRWLFETGDERRLAKLKQDLSDLEIHRDIPYLADGDRGHLLDLYRLPGLDAGAPVMINIHGGGLFASYKEVNANFNYEWARLGFHTISISYRRIPEVHLKDQIHDVMSAMRYIGEHAGDLDDRGQREEEKHDQRGEQHQRIGQKTEQVVHPDVAQAGQLQTAVEQAARRGIDDEA